MAASSRLALKMGTGLVLCIVGLSHIVSQEEIIYNALPSLLHCSIPSTRMPFDKAMCNIPTQH